MFQLNKAHRKDLDDESHNTEIEVKYVEGVFHVPAGAGFYFALDFC